MRIVLHLSLPFTLVSCLALQDSTIWVEREIYDSATSLLSLMMRENSRITDNGSSMWELRAGKYKVYGCEAKPTTLKRPSPSDSFENHMHSIELGVA